MYLVSSIWCYDLPGDVNLETPNNPIDITIPPSDVYLTKVESLVSAMNNKIQPIFDQSIKNSQTIAEMQQEIQELKSSNDTINGNQVQMWNYLLAVPRNTFLLFALYFDILFGLVLLTVIYSVSRRYIGKKVQDVEILLLKRKVKQMERNTKDKDDLVTRLNAENYDLSKKLLEIADEKKISVRAKEIFTEKNVNSKTKIRCVTDEVI
jgi:hypothetical protein